MSFTYPLTMPASPSPASFRIVPQSMVAVTTSPLSGVSRSFAHQGQLWHVEAAYPPIWNSTAHSNTVSAGEWMAWHGQLNGRYGTFTWALPKNAGSTSRGTATGSPLVNGSNQTGDTLITDGWTNSISTLKKGDYFNLGSYLHMSVADSTSDGSGNSTLRLWPNLRISPADNSSLTVSACTVVLRLDGEVTFDVEVGGIYNLSFSATEAL